MRVKRLSERSRHVQTNPSRISRNQRQNDNRRRIRRHGNKLSRNGNSDTLKIHLQHGHAAEQVRA